MIQFSQENIERLNTQEIEQLNALANKAGANVGNGFDVEAYIAKIEANTKEEAEYTQNLEQTFI